MESVKPGWKTSEFWLHALASAPAILAVIPGVPAAVGVIVAAVSNICAAFYSGNRTALKSRALDMAAAALEAAAEKAK